MISKDTQLCVSLSSRPGQFGTRFQNYLYRELNLDFIYKAFQTLDIQGAITGIRALGIRGAAISMPHKESCIPFLDELDETAKGIQSVNTLVNNSGKLTGYNTDFSAVRSLIKKQNIPGSTSIVLLGSGGMAKAVAAALHNLELKNTLIVSRNAKTGQSLAEKYAFQWQHDLPATQHEFYINATPIGMDGNSSLSNCPLSDDQIKYSSIIMEVVALPPLTPLLKKAQSFYKKTISGSDIIVLQAVEQFVLYTGIRPNQDLIARAAQHAFSL